MKRYPLEGDFGFFSSERHGKVLRIRFKHNLLEHLVDLSKRDVVIDFANQITIADDINVIILNSDFTDSGCEAYNRFFMENLKDRNCPVLHRLCNISSQLVLGIISLDRIVIHVSQGSLISLFFNVSLACDYRIAAENTIFCNPYLSLGMVPLGGGPYFLSRLLGAGQIYEILLLNKEINAQQALNLGLVDRVVSLEALESTAMDVAQRFADNHPDTITHLKRLVNFSKREVLEYFELESREITKIINTGFTRKAG